MLRAYNAEADNCVRSLRSGNIRTAKKRLESAMEAIEKLGVIMEMRVNPDYHQLRVEELELTADFQMKVQEEKERPARNASELREQQRAEQGTRGRAGAAGQGTCALRQRSRGAARRRATTPRPPSWRAASHDIDEAIEANDYRAANIRAGYIYVISNIGAFGPNMVKIGMTRRLEPRDRVRELGDASVPFLYDTHALFFSDDAVTLENELHKAFADRRVNHVNERREFFFATPAEVRELLVREGRRPARVQRRAGGAGVLPVPRALAELRRLTQGDTVAGACGQRVGREAERASEPACASAVVTTNSESFAGRGVPVVGMRGGLDRGYRSETGSRRKGRPGRTTVRQVRCAPPETLPLDLNLGSTRNVNPHGSATAVGDFASTCVLYPGPQPSGAARGV